MRYEGVVYRPPSEADSLIVQVTIGCSHNKCLFCVMYKDKKFRMKDIEDLREEIRSAALYGRVRRVFLGDGDALAADTGLLVEVLEELRKAFPLLERVGIYAGPQNVLGKSQEELVTLRKHGLSIAYYGVESGDDAILADMRKGATAQEIVDAGRRLIEAGLTLSVTVILGLGGRDRSEEHATATARVVSQIDPQFLAPLTLIIPEGSPIHRRIERRLFKPCDRFGTLRELRILLQEVEVTRCVFRCNHASNYLPLRGTLPNDKERLLRVLDACLASRDGSVLRPEWARSL